jgi:tRNA pseudouridine55 synthase
MLLATKACTPSTCASPSTLLARAAGAIVAPSFLLRSARTPPSTARRAAAADAGATRMAENDELDALYGAAEEEVLPVAPAPAPEPAPAPPPNQAEEEKPKPPKPPPPPPQPRAPPTLLHPKDPLPSDLRAAFSNAVVLIDKPPGWSSFDVCHALKRPLKALGVSKVGHAGTLDPMATGLLVVCTGQGTKAIETFMGRDKAYEATLRLGQATPSQDAETAVCEEMPWEDVTDEELKKIAREKLTGEGVLQKPPIFSALHAGGGKRLYELAREGGEAAKRAEEARPARPVNVASFALEPRPAKGELSAEECARLDAEQAAALAAREAAAAEAEASDADRRAQRERRGGGRTPSEESEDGVGAEEAGGATTTQGDAAQPAQKSGRARRRDRAERAPVVPYDPRRDVRFTCVVSKGTYVRTLGADLAELAGTKGHLTALRRTAVGDDLRVSDAWDVRELVSRMREGLAAMGIEEAPPRERNFGGGSGRGRRRGKGRGSGGGGGGGKRAKTE